MCPELTPAAFAPSRSTHTSRRGTATSATSEVTSSICAISIHNFKVSAVFFRPQTGEIRVMAFHDSSTFSTLILFLLSENVQEVIFGGTSIPYAVNLFFEEHLGFVLVTIVQKHLFSADVGQQLFKTLVFNEQKHLLDEIMSPALFGCFRAVISHVQSSKNLIFAPQTISCVKKSPVGRMRLDPHSFFDLDLESLFLIINSCQSPMGSRLLWSELVMPPCDVRTIQSRQEAILALDMLDDNVLQLYLQSSDIIKTLGKMLGPPRSGKDALTIVRQFESMKIFLENCIHIAICLEPIAAHSFLLAEMQRICSSSSIKSLLDTLSTVFVSDYQAIAIELFPPIEAVYSIVETYMKSNKMLFMIAANVSKALDFHRRTFLELLYDISMLIEVMQGRIGAPLRLIVLNSSVTCSCALKKLSYIDGKLVEHLSELLGTAVTVDRITKTTVRFSPEDFRTLGTHLTRTKDELCDTILLVLSGIIPRLNNENSEMIANDELIAPSSHLRIHLSPLLWAFDAVALLDVLYALHRIPTAVEGLGSDEFCIPELSDDFSFSMLNVLSLTDYKRVVEAGDPWRHNSLVSRRAMSLVMGGNGQGKSTLLRGIGAAVIIHQVGGRVPATQASFPIFQHFCTVFPTISELSIHGGALQQELMRVKQALEFLGSETEEMLFLADELFTTTAFNDASALLFGVLEHLISQSVLGFVSTHLANVGALLVEFYDDVSCLHFMDAPSEVSRKRLASYSDVSLFEDENPSHLLSNDTPKPASNPPYGILAAVRSGFGGELAARMMNNRKCILAQIRAPVAQPTTIMSTTVARQRDIHSIPFTDAYRAYKRIYELSTSGLSSLSVKNIVQELQRSIFGDAQEDYTI
ncbi:hypothetical protein PCE1_004027 [Barthelona sp. PCE]